MSPRLTLRPVALDAFAVVAPNGAVLAILPREQAREALSALAPPSVARGEVTVSYKPRLRLVHINDNYPRTRCVA